MVSNNSINYSSMPMGSHATAGGPHTPSTPQAAVGIPAQRQQVPMQQAAPPQMQPQLMPMQQMPMQIPISQFPTGQQTVAGMPLPPTSGAAPVSFEALGPVPVMSTEYTQGYLATKIGSKIKAEFLIGADNYEDREGILTTVGISYIIINEVQTNNPILCDIYSIKFVRFYK